MEHFKLKSGTMNEWAIQDEEKILIRGTYDEIFHIWNMNTQSDNTIEEYCGKQRDSKLLLKEFK